MILSGPIDTVFVDAGGVLLHPNWTRVSEVLADMGIMTDARAFREAEWSVTKELDDESLIRRTDDAARWTTFMSFVFRRAGLNLDSRSEADCIARLRAYHDEHNLWEHVPSDVPEALALLREQARLVVISNANGTVRKKLERVGLASYFDDILDSFVEGVEKPDPRLFEIAMTRIGATPARTVHVGDFYFIDVVGARRAGLQAVLLDPTQANTHDDCISVGSLREFAHLVAAANLGWTL